jgi:hypothetical protein
VCSKLISKLSVLRTVTRLIYRRYIRCLLTTSATVFAFTACASAAPPASMRTNAPASRQSDAITVMHPLNAFLANPTCETLDRLAKKTQGILPMVTSQPPQVRDQLGNLIPYQHACLQVQAKWRKEYGALPPQVPWPVQRRLIKQGATLEWFMLARESGLGEQSLESPSVSP